jgi:hypothetical protein
MPSSFDQYETAFLGFFLTRVATHSSVEEHLRTLDQQVSEESEGAGKNSKAKQPVHF